METFKDSRTKVSGFNNPVLFCLKLVENCAPLLWDIVDKGSFLQAAPSYENPDFKLDHVWSGEEGEVLNLLHRIATEYKFSLILEDGKIGLKTHARRPPTFREGDIARTTLDAVSWKCKYPNNNFQELWIYYDDETLHNANWALAPGYCGGVELKGWDKNDFKVINRICDMCSGRGRIGERLRICGKNL